MSQPQQPNPLSDDEARQLAEHLALVTKSGLPLAPALRAAAAEIPSRRLTQALGFLAQNLESGQSLASVLEANPHLLPPHMRRLIETGSRSGNLPEVLVQLVEIDRTSADLRRSLRVAIAYPILLLVLWGALVVFLAYNVIPALGHLFEDFKTVQPLSTWLLLKISGPGVLTVLVFLMAALPMILFTLRFSLRPLGWHRLLIELPLYGPTLLWRGVANWSRLLALLLRQGVPLPEAIKLAAEGLHAPVVTVDGLRISKMVAGGRKLSDALSAVRDLPASLAPLVRWGEEHNALPEAFDTAADMFENRVQMRAALLQSILPPLVFVATAVGALWVVNAMMMPLMKLINVLSFGRALPGNGMPLWTDDIAKEGLRIVAITAVVWLVLVMFFWFISTPLGAFLSRLFGGDGRPAKTGLMALVRAVLRFIIWLLTYVLLLVAMTGLAGAWGFLLWLATLVIIVTVKVRYSEMDRRALLWLLAVAAEKGIPLSAAARSFADERYDKLGKRADHLAIALDQGLPLDKALAASDIQLPNDALVAVRAGCATGSLAPLLKSTSRYAASMDAAIQAAVGRIVYLLIFMFFASFTIAFMQIKIVPAFIKIFSDFHQRLPPVALAFSRPLFHAPTFLTLVAVLFTCLLMAFLYTLARYTGLLRWDPPIVRRMTLPLDEALVLRSLAESVDDQKPLDATLWILAKRYPKRHVRRRLRRAAERVNEGAHWCDSLQANRLLTAADAGVLKAAGRVGNLSWAMNNAADRLVRRFTTRLLGVMSVCFPLVVLMFGAVVFLLAVGLIFPLAQLILHLA